MIVRAKGSKGSKGSKGRLTGALRNQGASGLFAYIARCADEAQLIAMFRFALAKHWKSELCHLVGLCSCEAPAKRPFEPFVPFDTFALTIPGKPQAFLLPTNIGNWQH